MPTTQVSELTASGLSTTWVFGVMLSGFAFAIFLNALAFIAGGKHFTDFLSR